MAGAAAFASCAHRGSPRTPAQATAAFEAALARGDAPAAYRAMSDSFRRHVPFERFRQDVTALDADDLARLRRWASAAEGQVTVRPVSDPLPVSLTPEGGGWSLAELPVRPFGQETPEEALRTFVRAASRRRYDVLLRLVPERERGNVTVERLRGAWEGAGSADALRMVEELRLHVADPIVVDADRATLTYESSGRARVVRFVREEGSWRLDRID
jgi:hypothetical protein